MLSTNLIGVVVLVIVLLFGSAEAIDTVTGIDAHGAIVVRVTQHNNPPVHGVVAIGHGPAPTASPYDALFVRWQEDVPSVVTERGTVIITVRERGSIGCPPPKAPPLVRQENGTYEKSIIMIIPTVACWHEATWQEEWTALPEEGGVFLRRIEKE
jgi:hypothetical protein